MKIQPSLDSKLSLVVATSFFVGILASAYSLFVVRQNLSPDNFQLAFITIGFTFLVGAIAINLKASHKIEKVVYINKQSASVERVQLQESDDAIKLDAQGIEKILEGSFDPLQRALNEICKQLKAGQGAMYLASDNKLELKFGYALSLDRNETTTYEFGEGLIGRVAAQKEILCLDKLPKDYVTIYSGLGSASPSFLVIVPILNGDSVKGVFEVSTFHSLNDNTLNSLKHIATVLGNIMHHEKITKYAA